MLTEIFKPQPENTKGKINMNTSLTLPDIYRTQHVRRWHIVQSKREQTVAEHSFMVAMISMAIMKEFEITSPEVRSLVFEWALIHDLPEVVLGDTVSPVKAKAKQAFKIMEDIVDPELRFFEEDLPDVIIRIVKAADYIDALKFLDAEGVNGQAKSIFTRLYSDFFEHLDASQELHPKWPWYNCDRVLHQIMSGHETFIDNLV